MVVIRTQYMADLNCWQDCSDKTRSQIKNCMARQVLRKQEEKRPRLLYRPIPFGKPWRLPRADIIDYFNFGFDENTWKQYRFSMTSAQEQFDQPVSESLQSRSSKCEVPKGRAIQVEDSVFERQPSIHVRHRHDIDSDVVIQIKVQGSPGNDSGSVKSNIHGLSGVGELISGKKSRLVKKEMR